MLTSQIDFKLTKEKRADKGEEGNGWYKNEQKIMDPNTIDYLIKSHI